eukprot:3937050-Amphidinium_carterae.1
MQSIVACSRVLAHVLLGKNLKRCTVQSCPFRCTSSRQLAMGIGSGDRYSNPEHVELPKTCKGHLVRADTPIAIISGLPCLHGRWLKLQLSYAANSSKVSPSTNHSRAITVCGRASWQTPRSGIVVLSDCRLACSAH